MPQYQQQSNGALFVLTELTTDTSSHVTYGPRPENIKQRALVPHTLGNIQQRQNGERATAKASTRHES